MQDASLSYDPETPPDEIQSDVVFREGQTLGGHVTHTPRLIAMDLKGYFILLHAFIMLKTPSVLEQLYLPAGFELNVSYFVKMFNYFV